MRHNVKNAERIEVLTQWEDLEEIKDNGNRNNIEIEIEITSRNKGPLINNTTSILT